jgi:hypothetical protein
VLGNASIPDGVRPLSAIEPSGAVIGGSAIPAATAASSSARTAAITVAGRCAGSLAIIHAIT